MSPPPATVSQRWRYLLLNVLVFGLCYPSANLLAHRAGITRHAALPFEAAIPFLPWMIIPYMSSGLFFCLVFLVAGSQNQLRILAQRTLLATVLASLVFIMYPLQYSWGRPAIAPGWLASLYASLDIMDKPYNQLPSLHVAYCLLFWQSLRLRLRPGPARILLATWLLLTAVSTVFTYQHHVLDVFGGIALALFCMWAVELRVSEAQVAFYYLMMAGIVLAVGVCGLHSWLAFYLACSLSLVALAYLRHDSHFLHKCKGRHPWWIWLLYAPYLSGYQLTWLAVVWRERRKPAIVKLTPQLWVGRRLSNTEALQLPPDCTIIDLANELNETPALRRHNSRHYRHFPLLDLRTPPADTVQAVLQCLNTEISAGKTVYLHCAMGYSRCILLAKLFMSQGNLSKQ